HEVHGSRRVYGGPLGRAGARRLAALENRRDAATGHVVDGHRDLGLGRQRVFDVRDASGDLRDLEVHLLLLPVGSVVIAVATIGTGAAEDAEVRPVVDALAVAPSVMRHAQRDRALARGAALVGGGERHVVDAAVAVAVTLRAHARVAILVDARATGAVAGGFVL